MQPEKVAFDEVSCLLRTLVRFHVGLAELRGLRAPNNKNSFKGAGALCEKFGVVFGVDIRQV